MGKYLQLKSVRIKRVAIFAKGKGMDSERNEYEADDGNQTGERLLGR